MKYIFRICLSLLLIIYLSHKVDWIAIYSALCRIDIRIYICSFIVTLAGPYLIAYKYFLLVKKTSLFLPLGRLFRIQMISRFFALFFPTALGQDAFRWYKVTKNKTDKSFFVGAILFERIVFILVLVGFGLIPLILYQDKTAIVELRHHIIPVATGFILLLSLGIAYLFSSRCQKWVRKIVRVIFPALVKDKLDRFLQEMVLKDKSPSMVMSLVALTICWQIVLIARVFLLFKAVDIPLGLMEAAWMASLVMLMQILPISFAGLGIREGVFAYLFTLFGLPAEKGFLIGILFFSQMLFLAIIGAVLNFWEE